MYHGIGVAVDSSSYQHSDHHIRAGGHQLQQEKQLRAHTGPRLSDPIPWFFIALLVLGVPILFGTLVFTSLPYASATVSTAKEYQIVHAIGHQWRWELDNTRLKAGQPAEFRVASGDVNHGFGIYDSSLHLLTQIQTMPGYTNIMRYTFQAPGTYKVMCLEYCGLAHHGMLAELTVTE